MNLYDSLLERSDGKQYSNYFSMCCPFPHNGRLESHPSMFVYEDGRFHCSACGKSGTHKFLDKVLGSHYFPTKSNTVSNILPSWRRWEEKWGSVEGIAEYAHQNLLRYKQFQGYFKRRKVEEFIDRGFLGYIEGWAVIPIYDFAGKLVDLVVRAVSGKGDTRYVVKPKKNEIRPCFCPNWKETLGHEQIYVVYGVFDAVSLELIGLPVVTGITGKSLSAELIKPLGKRVVILPDAGEEREAHLLANQLGWRGSVKELNYPLDCKDPDEVRVKYGNQYLKDLIEM